MQAAMRLGPEDEEDDDELPDELKFDIPDDDELDAFDEPDEEMLKELQAEFVDVSEDVDETARQERLMAAREAASSSARAEEGFKFPQPDERGYYLSELFYKAAYIDAALSMEKSEVYLSCCSPKPLTCTDIHYILHRYSFTDIHSFQATLMLLCTASNATPKRSSRATCSSATHPIPPLLKKWSQ